MQLRLHQYDIEFQYVVGKRLLIADTLSRAYFSVPESQVRPVATSALLGIPDKITLAVAQAIAKDTDL